MVRRRVRGLLTDPRGPDATGVIWRFFTQVAGDTPQG